VKQVGIENPVINSPFQEPGRHFKFTDEGITNEVIDGRRSSSYFVPIARPRKKGQKQLEFDTEWTQDRIEEDKVVNQIRARVKLWREGACWSTGLAPTGSSGCESAARSAAPRTASFATALISLSASTHATPAARTSEAWRVIVTRELTLGRDTNGAR
jgi:hypothetical protein